MGLQVGRIGRAVATTTIYKAASSGKAPLLAAAIAVLGQASSDVTHSLDVVQATSAADGRAFGARSQIARQVAELFPEDGRDAVGGIPVYILPLNAGDTAVAAAGSFEADGTATVVEEWRVEIGGVDTATFALPVGADGDAFATAATAAVQAQTAIEANAAVDGTDTNKVNLTAPWKGATGNDITIRLHGPADSAFTVTITAMAGGAVNPSAAQIQAAFAKLAAVQVTDMVNPFGEDDTVLDAIATLNEGYWTQNRPKPLMVWRGGTDASSATAIAATTDRKTDRTNARINVEGSPSSPWAIAARFACRRAQVGNDRPAWDYARQVLDGIKPGDAEELWDDTKREAVLAAGGATTVVEDGFVKVSDVITPYREEEDQNAYRFAKSLAKLQNIQYAMHLKFATARFDGAPLVSDDTEPKPAGAVSPSDFVTEARILLDELAAQALITDVASCKAAVSVTIGGAGSDPDWVDIIIPVKLSGNANKINMTLRWQPYLPAAA